MYNAAAPVRTITRTTARRPARTGVTAVEVALVALIVAVLCTAALASGSKRHMATATEVVRVSQGDTLWGLARSHPVPDLTTAQTADLIAEMNGIEAGQLVAGMTLKVPDSPGAVGRTAMALR